MKWTLIYKNMLILSSKYQYSSCLQISYCSNNAIHYNRLYMQSTQLGTNKMHNYVVMCMGEYIHTTKLVPELTSSTCEIYVHALDI